MLDANKPADAQRIVAAYLQMMETHATADVYPGSLRDLPHARDVIRTAFRTSTTALLASGQMTDELSDYLETAYVSLADYLEEESATLLREYARAGEELAADTARPPRERNTTEPWRRIAEQSRLAGEIARAVSIDAERLRAEFRSWRAAGDTPVAPAN